VKLALWQWQTNWWSAAFIALELLLWYICLLVATNIGVTTDITSFIRSFVLGWYGLWQNVQALSAFWLLLLLVTAGTLLPQLFYSIFMRRFYPEFRDLAMECEFHKLDNKALREWELPPSSRQHRLVKDAPHRQARPWRVLSILQGLRSRQEKAPSVSDAGRTK
jgi:phospholipid-transporting ATPase